MTPRRIHSSCNDLRDDRPKLALNKNDALAQTPVKRWLFEHKWSLGPTAQAIWTAILGFLIFAIPLYAVSIYGARTSQPLMAIDSLLVWAGAAVTFLFYSAHLWVPAVARRAGIAESPVPWRVGANLRRDLHLIWILLVFSAPRAF